MRIEERTRDGVTILDLKGKLILGDGDALLKDKVHSLLHHGRLLNLTKRIHDLLAIAKLLTVFETFSDEPDAVRSFSSAEV